MNDQQVQAARKLSAVIISLGEIAETVSAAENSGRQIILTIDDLRSFGTFLAHASERIAEAAEMAGLVLSSPLAVSSHQEVAPTKRWEPKIITGGLP